ncbi:proteasome regulatory particle lid subunit RPN9 NDAI_0H01630 [Naumovozyma dairenensis CBS 421]|uniref:PCI domain-containing protein n=1 Tax=Naumovozyma dairenensis (strain ATCC 10597 / BCRC 20456 / CBS 421 / NBRC 0211 / NRRL Y-12639) TaxID=1071378 RepID=G0WEX6_NAUDC|nr:hypothetical protein NDAI_0H01630 [Naumovozyma dairenensis CBS 421]CCD26337.1 hypothetical protein NDAI_0H01630 [Naumovozyma dairenensis CBS 421]
MSTANIHEIDTVLSTLRIEGDSNLEPFFQEFETLYEKKLWHQLTKSLIEFYHQPSSVSLRLRLYDTFISKFYDKINQLDLIEFLLLSLKDNSNIEDSLNYLNDLKMNFIQLDNENKRNTGLKDHKFGCLLIDIEIARCYLLKDELIRSRELLDKIETKFNYNLNINPIPLKLKNAFYAVNSQYFKLKNDFNSFYYTSLLYLSTLNDNENENGNESSSSSFLNEIDWKNCAYDLSIAALLGDKIYNFGELLNHPIMSNILNDPNYQWLLNLLNSLTNGDFNKFDNLIKHDENLKKSSNSILLKHEDFLRQKICLMTLIETVFAKNIRTLTFNDISVATHLPEDNVEHLIMRAISLGLLKGSIDQVNQLVIITWVQPRIINFDQIDKMKNRLVEWNEQVKALAEKMEEKGKPIWV